MSTSFLPCVRRNASVALRRSALPLAVAFALSVIVSTSPASAQYDGGIGGEADAELTVSDDSVIAGARLTISGSGFRANSEVLIVFQSSPVTLGTATTSAAGSFSAQVTIPADAPAGAHTITATGPAPDGGTRVLRSALTVSQTQAQQPGQATGQPSGGQSSGQPSRGGGFLPRTGGGIAVLVGVALAAWMTGAVLVTAGRRRRGAVRSRSE